ncbi:hypothetical protein OE749_09675 [Aestuariibacter sp. AA17]|uniref:Uncharacterized protein n=1 Tax=Fluctibacter corallii TaxID=2984329 RepID=A0ABT3A8E4_9ALTE|nr:hypothetical protein [Aestuariibacter sp. AA17]MCV2884965.1 hypothetical protein [Aestuariibacter sp. AA17]
MQAAVANQFDKAQTALEAMETASREVMRLLDELNDQLQHCAVLGRQFPWGELKHNT